MQTHIPYYYAITETLIRILLLSVAGSRMIIDLIKFCLMIFFMLKHFRPDSWHIVLVRANIHLTHFARPGKVINQILRIEY